MIFNFQYHIPSAMTEGKWNWIQYQHNNPKSAAGRAVLSHYRGSERPGDVEIWVRKKEKVKRFRVRFHADDVGFDVIALKDPLKDTL